MTSNFDRSQNRRDERQASADRRLSILRRASDAEADLGRLFGAAGPASLQRPLCANSGRSAEQEAFPLAPQALFAYGRRFRRSPPLEHLAAQDRSRDLAVRSNIQSDLPDHLPRYRLDARFSLPIGLVSSDASALGKADTGAVPVAVMIMELA